MRPRLLTPIERRVVRAALMRQIDAQERLLSRTTQDDVHLARERVIDDLYTAKQLLAIFGRLEIKDD